MNHKTRAERKRTLAELSTQPEGFTPDDLVKALAIEYEAANCMVKSYTNSGLIFRSTEWGADGRRHYFDTQERAAEWSARNVGHQRRIVLTQRESFASRRKQASVPQFTSADDGQPAVQRAPVIYGDKRYQIQPGEEVPKLFRKLPLGATLYGMTA